MSERIAKLGLRAHIQKTDILADNMMELEEQLPEAYGQEIRPVIGKLYEIKALLTEFDAAVKDPAFIRHTHEIVSRVGKEAQKCLRTLDSLDKVVYNAKRVYHASSQQSPERLWKSILTAFRDFEHDEVASRLDAHKKAMDETVTFLKNTNASRYTRKAEARPELPRLRSSRNIPPGQYEPPPPAQYWQAQRPEERRRRPSVERQPSQMRYAPGPPSPAMQMPPTPPLYDSPPQRPYSTPVLSSSWQPPSPPSPYGRAYGGPMPGGPMPMYDHRPMTPVSPVSPVSPLSGQPSYYSRRYSNQSSPTTAYNNMAMPPSPTSPPAPTRPKTRNSKSRPSPSPGKWWLEMLRPSPGNTVLPTPSRNSTCLGPPMENITKDADEEELLTFELDNGLRVRLVQNQKTKAAKVVCTQGGDNAWGSSRKGVYDFQTVIEASRLKISRVGSGIHLKQGSVLWARLYFGTYESMTLFKHAFLALRSQGPNPVHTSPTESFKEDVTGERVHFSGRIEDEGYVHMLRVTEDLQSGAVRMAAARISETSDVTVWTAFVTNQITSANFLSQHAHDTVALSDLRRISFSEIFETRTYHSFPLRFKNPSDNATFEKTINRLAHYHNPQPAKPASARRTSQQYPTYQQDYFTAVY